MNTGTWHSYSRVYSPGPRKKMIKCNQYCIIHDFMSDETERSVRASASLEVAQRAYDLWRQSPICLRCAMPLTIRRLAPGHRHQVWEWVMAHDARRMLQPSPAVHSTVGPTGGSHRDIGDKMPHVASPSRRAWNILTPLRRATRPPRPREASSAAPPESDTASLRKEVAATPLDH